jgi:DNA polymerase III subunit epsilon
MRHVVLDTETTGLDAKNGHRVIEIGCVELIDRAPTGAHYHVYLNPDRAIDEEAIKVHGITSEFLADKPRFADIVDEFCDFIMGAVLIIHNAKFDMGFLDMEITRLGRPPLLKTVVPDVVDTLEMSKKQNPGKKASLDALCQRFEINNRHRTLHGALLDARILADVYRAMTRGQDSLLSKMNGVPETIHSETATPTQRRASLRTVLPSPEEQEAHRVLMAQIDKESKGMALWRP